MEGEVALGDQIRILSGKNRGHEGWLDLGDPNLHPDRVNIIVDLGKNKWMKTWAKQCNVGPIRSVQKTYWEAVLRCAPDIELKLNTLADDLAECRITNINEVTAYLVDGFKRSVKTREDMMGKYKIKTRHIEYPPMEKIHGV